MKCIEKPVLVDCDGVLCDFIGECITYLNKRFDTNFRYGDMFDDIRKVVGPKFWDEETEAHVLSNGFAKNMRELPGAVDGVKKIQDAGYKVMFLTSPYGGSPTWAFDRFKWLEERLGATRDDVIFAREKRYVDGITLIDDKVSNVVKWAEYNKTTGLLVTQPWNVDDAESVHSLVLRPAGWDSILKLLDNS